MVAVKFAHVDPTLEAAQAAYNAKRNTEEAKNPRAYLGASGLGHECSRRLWYGFRGVKQPPVDNYSAIDDGHLSEQVMAERLNLLDGLQVVTVDEEGNQFAVKACHGHLRGHMDGAALGLLQAPKTWHVWEAKSCNETKFKSLKKLIDEKGEKHALAAWDMVFYVQAQIYMELTGMTRHWLVCCTPGVRDWVGIRTELDSEFAQAQIARAEDIITSDDAPMRITNDPGHFVCKWCPFKEECHYKKVPKPDCRNCVHSLTLTDGDGEWACFKHDKFKNECPDHVFLPDMISYARKKDAHEDENWVAYELEDGRTFKNGTRPNNSLIYSSIELCETDPVLIQDADTDTLRAQFGGTIEKSEPVKDGYLPDMEIPF